MVAVEFDPLQRKTAGLESHVAALMGLVAVQSANVLPLAVDVTTLGHAEKTGLLATLGRGESDRQPDAGEQELVVAERDHEPAGRGRTGAAACRQRGILRSHDHREPVRELRWGGTFE